MYTHTHAKSNGNWDFRIFVGSDYEMETGDFRIYAG